MNLVRTQKNIFSDKKKTKLQPQKLNFFMLEGLGARTPSGKHKAIGLVRLPLENIKAT